jgi:hypothetical protein
MDSLHLLHLMLLCAWAGLLLAEFVIELLARDDVAIRHVARLHLWLDAVAEVPLLLGILATGAWLSVRAWPLSAIHWVKIAAAGVAIGLNLWCATQVYARWRAARAPLDAGGAARTRRYHARVRLAALGVPFGVVAAYIGLTRSLRV